MTQLKTNLFSMLSIARLLQYNNAISIARMFFNAPNASSSAAHEVRQTSASENYTPNPSASIPLTPARQRLLDDIIALYTCEPTVERVKRYSPDCV